MTNVLIVEDQKMAQENMESIIRASETYTLAGVIPNAADAELFCMRTQVDLVLMDVCTAHDENGIEACALLKKKFPKIKIIVDDLLLHPPGSGRRLPDTHRCMNRKA